MVRTTRCPTYSTISPHRAAAGSALIGIGAGCITSSRLRARCSSFDGLEGIQGTARLPTTSPGLRRSNNSRDACFVGEDSSSSKVRRISNLENAIGLIYIVARWSSDYGFCVGRNSLYPEGSWSNDGHEAPEARL